MVITDFLLLSTAGLMAQNGTEAMVPAAACLCVFPVRPALRICAVLILNSACLCSVGIPGIKELLSAGSYVIDVYRVLKITLSKLGNK